MYFSSCFWNAGLTKVRDNFHLNLEKIANKASNRISKVFSTSLTIPRGKAVARRGRQNRRLKSRQTQTQVCHPLFCSLARNLVWNTASVALSTRIWRACNSMGPMSKFLPSNGTQAKWSSERKVGKVSV